jgi:putative Mg2+ transporter-C (MgtC) family protein
MSAVAAAQTGLPLGGQGWRQAGELGLALLLSAAVGLEREWRQKDAGLRTHTLVGVGAALFMLVSKYGFSDVLAAQRVVLDPSRVAAQIVSGIGFIGAGLIFIRRDSVRGLTTAASIWVTAAIGSAAGAGLPILAALATGIYFVVVAVFPPLVRRLPISASAVSAVRVAIPTAAACCARSCERPLVAGSRSTTWPPRRWARDGPRTGGRPTGWRQPSR